MVLAASQKTALLVEDDAAFRELIHYYLADLGLEVEAVADGASALAWLRTKVPALVCCDLMLPDMSGYDVCEQIKKMSPLRGTPVLMMSARGMPLDLAHARELGVDKYLVKPFTRDEFMKAAGELLEGTGPKRP